VAYAVASRITAIDGVAIENRPLHNFERRFLRTRSVTAVEAMPPDTAILAGRVVEAGRPHAAGLRP